MVSVRTVQTETDILTGTGGVSVMDRYSSYTQCCVLSVQDNVSTFYCFDEGKGLLGEEGRNLSKGSQGS